MRGEGNFAEIIKQQVNLAKEKYFTGRKIHPYNTELFFQNKDGQLKLF
jgi:hypothetical protein